MSWIKKANIENEIPSENWHKPPQTDRDFAQRDEAHERRSVGAYKHTPSVAAPTYSPEQQKALDEALTRIDQSNKGRTQ